MELKPTERVRGRKLQQRRATHFRLFPLCMACEAKGRVTIATELDHIVPLFKGGSDEPENWAGLCTECHKVKTATDMGHKPRVTIGLDGWPVA